MNITEVLGDGFFYGGGVAMAFLMLLIATPKRRSMLARFVLCLLSVILIVVQGAFWVASTMFQAIGVGRVPERRWIPSIWVAVMLAGDDLDSSYCLARCEDVCRRSEVMQQ